jgi:hypothetical protein
MISDPSSVYPLLKGSSTPDWDVAQSDPPAGLIIIINSDRLYILWSKMEFDERPDMRNTGETDWSSQQPKNLSESIR